MLKKLGHLSPPTKHKPLAMASPRQETQAAAPLEPRDGFTKTVGTFALLGLAALGATACVPQEPSSAATTEVEVETPTSTDTISSTAQELGGSGNKIDLLNDHDPTIVIGNDGSIANRVGNSIIRSDGSVSTDIGNTRLNSDGTTSTRLGNTVINSDGTTSTRVGNTVINSDGSTRTRVGNTTFNSDGTTSTRIGNTVFHSDGTITQEF